MSRQSQVSQINALGIWILFLAAFIFSTPAVFAANTNSDMYVSSSSSGGAGNDTWSGVANGTVRVYVFADNLSGIGAVSFTLTWDPAVLTYSSVSNGSANSTWSAFPSTGSGSVTFTSSNSSAPITGSTLQIAVVTLTVNASPGNSTNLTLSSLSVADTSFNTYTPADAGNGTFSLASVVNGACGSANKTYTYGSNSYGTDTFCSAGTASPSSPSFPGSGSTVDWTCDGSNGGTDASCSATLQAPAAPTITSEPANQSAGIGGSAAFSVTATGVPAPTSYQWKLSTDGGSTFNSITGATSTSYTVSSVTGAENGNEYECVVSNGISPDATSSAATLTVNYAPSISTDPLSQTADAGTSVTFTAAATGNPTPNYQWQVSTNGGSSFSNISGATTDSYTINPVTSVQNGYQYRCVASNGVSPNATTTAATLTVDYAPVITTNPISQTKVVGTSATFTVVANANPSPGYQWEVSTDGGSTFNNISGATGSSYTVSSLTLTESGYKYECVVTNTLSSTTSNAATLTVTLAPVNGQCGPAAQVWPYGATSFGSDALCSAGNASPSSVNFPAAAQTANWVCQGLNSGMNARCSATQRPRIVFRFW